MLTRCISLPAANGSEAVLEMYIPSPCADINPNIRRPAILICPGGGYYFVAEGEGEPIALRFLPEGFNTFVIRYRVAPNRYPASVQDTAAALAYIRKHADELYTLPNQITVMGFSAGGHVAGSLGVRWTQAELWQPLGLTPEDVKPNAMVLCYPVISGGPFAHRESFENLTGSTCLADHEAHSLENLVTADCPPTFLFHTAEDDVVPVENSLLFGMALKAAGVPFEMKIDKEGPHGMALCNGFTSDYPCERSVPSADWPHRVACFLRKVFNIHFD